MIFGGPRRRRKWFFRDVDGGDGFGTLLAPGKGEGGWMIVSEGGYGNLVVYE